MSKSIRLVAPERITHAYASEKHVMVVTKTESLKTNYTLTELEQLLPGALFMRIHSSCIVNLSLIEEILLLGNHTYAVRLPGGTELPVGRTQYPLLQDRLKINRAI